MKPNFKQLAALAPDAIYSLNEAAGLLGMTSAGIRKWSRQGKISLKQIGSRLFVSGAELKKMIVQ